VISKSITIGSLICNVCRSILYNIIVYLYVTLAYNVTLHVCWDVKMDCVNDPSVKIDSDKTGDTGNMGQADGLTGQ